MDKPKTRRVEQHLYVNYLKRAEECLQGAYAALENKKYDLSAIASVHSGISAADAMCVYYLHCRSVGEKHTDAAELIKSIKELKHEESKAVTEKLSRILSMKNMAEYEERNIKPKEAETLFYNAQKFLEMIKAKL